MRVEPLRNEVLETSEGRRFRFLRRIGENAYIIELGSSTAILTRIDWNSLSENLQSGEYVRCEQQVTTIDDAIPSTKVEARRNRRLDVVLSLLYDSRLYERRNRVELIKTYADANSVSRQAIYMWLRLWFQNGQTADALLPRYYRLPTKQTPPSSDAGSSPSDSP
jgi:hypothetical protein